MLIKSYIELSVVLNNDKFTKVCSQVSQNNSIHESDENEYADTSFAEEGFLIQFRYSQYKKKIRLIVNTECILKEGDVSVNKLIRKTEKFILYYFNSELQLDDFVPSGMLLSTDLKVGRSNIDNYIKVLQRISRVKGFSPIEDEELNDDDGFFLKGNSNGIRFRIYDLGAEFSDVKGVLRPEVRLCKPKAIASYANSLEPAKQITTLLDQAERIFMDTFTRIIPYGDFYKKGTAVDLLFQNIKDAKLRRKMLRLVALIPEKKSLHLAQKEMGSRNMDKIMIAFAKINLSPITISKRHGVKYLTNLYEYL